MMWLIALLSLLGMTLRPWSIGEAWWICGGSLMLLLIGAIHPLDALHAVLQGLDVYAFLIGMLLLAEVLRRLDFFDVLAENALATAKGSPYRLFALVYALGVLMTMLLSNDTTAVILTPAIVATLRKTRADPLPYAFAGAMVANAASTLLPISNPANILLFGDHRLSLMLWLQHFGLASLASVCMTFGMLLVVWRKVLLRDSAMLIVESRHRRPSKLALSIVIGAVLIFGGVSVYGGDLGYTALVVAALACSLFCIVQRSDARPLLQALHWEIVPLVAGLFVIVHTLDRAGLLTGAVDLLRAAQRLGTPIDGFVVTTALTLGSAIVNNLPLALIATRTFAATPVSPYLHDIWLVAIDIGPNLVANASLATLLWMTLLRREGILVHPFRFFVVGAIVTPPALVAAVLLTR